MSDSYRVIAPYVTLRVKDVSGAPVLLGFYQGAVVENVDAESLRHHLEDGLLEKLDSEDAIYDETVGPVGAMAPTPLSDLPLAERTGDSNKAPAKSASKGDWEDYARSQGATDDDLDGATKEDLVDRYGA